MSVTYTKLGGDMALGSDGTEYLVLPCMFVPHGTEPCPKWLADHPDWFRVTATMHRRAVRPREPEPVPVPQEAPKRLELASADSAEADAMMARSIPPPAPLRRIAGKQREAVPGETAEEAAAVIGRSVQEVIHKRVLQ
jgi:hypothetical protein